MKEFITTEAKTETAVLVALITKTQDETDDRRYFVALTPEGEALTARLDAEMLAMTKRMYTSVSDEEMQTVYAFMDKCVSSLASMLGETIE